ncbi:tannase/feruloyl esterase family alpha/beta hydrolase [Acidipila sp. EB88]|uniref:tannase/feruloyl esterase family alpha/beta hydrolase n=1 Tax=Acidipila sp. EB88 TaxID=2305226 RepID=UPI0013150E64|nr:tannase/feruloyl esterase family alpha/beta hydrolase [Acidipila sp. EB88]
MSHARQLPEARVDLPMDLPVVRPVVDCASLAGLALRDAVGVDVALAAAPVSTPRGPFCHVTGVIAPAIHLEVDLPVEHWTQRLLETGCGGLCGMINASIGNAGTCAPALNGAFAVAATDMGHEAQMGAPGESNFAADPQKRIDFAYRANHLTALAAKALIRAYYGQPHRFAYFSGCSDGGREAMMEAQRFPEDFDGISAGAPAMYFQVQNSLNHAWTQAANTRADGSKILQGAQLQSLHAAVIRHCDLLDGIKDGLLTDPRACKVDPQWVLCSAHSAAANACLTPEQWTAASKLYMGPTDTAGHHFLPGGWQPGSELQWGGGMPGSGPPPQGSATGHRRDRTTTDLPHGPPPQQQGPAHSPGTGMLASMAPVVFPVATPADATAANYPFTVEQFHRAIQLHGLNDATDTDLRPFAAHGGKLLMYHGWSDTSIAPMISVAYFAAVQRDLGSDRVDQFLRLFMLPGMAHCGGGDGFQQFDTLTPLMAWVEHGRAPASLIAGKLPPFAGMGAGPDGRGGRPQTAPYARPDQPALATRAILPFPHTASQPLAMQPWIGAELLAPAAPLRYRVEDGKLTQK